MKEVDGYVLDQRPVPEVTVVPNLGPVRSSPLLILVWRSSWPIWMKMLFPSALHLRLCLVWQLQDRAYCQRPPCGVRNAWL